MEEFLTAILAALVTWLLGAWLLMLAGGALAIQNGWPTNVSFGTSVLVVLAVRCAVGKL